jgi:hypothetical protein
VRGIEGNAGEPVAVDGFVGGKNALTEVRDDLRVDGLAGLHHGARHLVGGKNDCAARGQHLRHGGLAAAEFAGEAYAQHGS